jgi:hypothetical protein
MTTFHLLLKQGYEVVFASILLLIEV